ncbi:hypothetical protein BLNAU_2891 [Blattamonas nauphoetae]|uniref:Uncharacterized protein n=1 Tax=Blattamonas nauphoetae TaxID=2049346 RepID=A0ABQ9YEN8_9EUKA|nr:hypothetical protein BLNAU_2891 [Blattamonas nauphoetae]
MVTKMVCFNPTFRVANMTGCMTHLSYLFNIPDVQQFLIHLPIKLVGLGVPSFVQTVLRSLIYSHVSLHPEVWEADHIQRENCEGERMC